MDNPIYRYPWSYAAEHGEEELYRESMKENIACKNFIEEAISHASVPVKYGVNFDAEKAVAEVIKQFGLERTAYVIANTIQQKDWDSRFSYENRRWAKTIPIFDDESNGTIANRRFVVDKPHSVLTDAFASEIRVLLAKVASSE